MSLTAAPDPAPAETRQLLLAAAAAVFAEVGFRNATVRQICQRAGANVAAVNYHFGDKETLYLEVLRYAQVLAARKYPTDLGTREDDPPAARLKAFVRSLLLRTFDPGPVAWHPKLMLREMIDPTGALETLVKERLRPMAEQLRRIVRELLGARGNEELVRLCTCSIVGQCVFYNHCRPVIGRVFPEQTFAPEDVEKIADHITRFSLGAIKALAKQRP